MAPDVLSQAGITPLVGAELLRLRTSASPQEQARMQPVMREKMAPMQDLAYGRWAVAALQRTVDHLAASDGVGDRLGVMGFCFGGSYSFALAAADSRIKVAIPFYGSPPDQTNVGNIGGPVLAFYGETDERLITGLPAVREQMARRGSISPRRSIPVSGTPSSTTPTRTRTTPVLRPMPGLAHWRCWSVRSPGTRAEPVERGACAGSGRRPTAFPHADRHVGWVGPT